MLFARPRQWHEHKITGRAALPVGLSGATRSAGRIRLAPARAGPPLDLIKRAPAPVRARFSARSSGGPPVWGSD